MPTVSVYQIMDDSSVTGKHPSILETSLLSEQRRCSSFPFPCLRWKWKKLYIKLNVLFCCSSCRDGGKGHTGHSRLRWGPSENTDHFGRSCTPSPCWYTLLLGRRVYVRSRGGGLWTGSPAEDKGRLSILRWVSTCIQAAKWYRVVNNNKFLHVCYRKKVGGCNTLQELIFPFQSPWPSLILSKRHTHQTTLEERRRGRAGRTGSWGSNRLVILLGACHRSSWKESTMMNGYIGTSWFYSLFVSVFPLSQCRMIRFNNQNIILLCTVHHSWCTRLRLSSCSIQHTFLW